MYTLNDESTLFVMSVLLFRNNDVLLFVAERLIFVHVQRSIPPFWLGLERVVLRGEHARAEVGQVRPSNNSQ